MPVVPRYQPGGRASSSGLPDASQVVRDRPVSDNFFSVAGEQIQSFLDNRREEEEKARKLAIDINTRDTAFEYHKAAMEAFHGEDGIANLSGKAFLEQSPQFLGGLKEIRQELMASNPELDAVAFDEMIRKVDANLFNAFIKKSGKARLEYDKDTMSSRIQLATESAIVDPNFFDNAVEIIENEVIGFADRYEGLDADSEAVQNTLRSHFTTLVTGAAENAIAAGEYDLASYYLAQDKIPIDFDARIEMVQKLQDASDEDLVLSIADRAFTNFRDNPTEGHEFIVATTEGTPEIRLAALEEFNDFLTPGRNIASEARTEFNFLKRQADEQDEEEAANYKSQIQQAIITGQVKSQKDLTDQFPDATLKLENSDWASLNKFIERQWEAPSLMTGALASEFSTLTTDREARNSLTTKDLDRLAATLPPKHFNTILRLRGEDVSQKDTFTRNNFNKLLGSRLDAAGLVGSKYAVIRGELTSEIMEATLADDFDINDANAISTLLDRVIQPDRIRAAQSEQKNKETNPKFAPTLSQFLNDNIRSYEIDDKAVQGTVSDMVREEMSRAGVDKKPSYSQMNSVWGRLMDETYATGVLGIFRKTLPEIYADAKPKEIAAAKKRLREQGVSQPTKAVIAMELAGAWNE